MCTQKIIDGTATKSRYLIKAWCGYSVYNHKTITQCHYFFFTLNKNYFCEMFDQRKQVTPYFQPGSLSEIFAIASLRQREAATRGVL